MLHAKDCAHLTAKDWTGIVAKIVKLKEGESLLLAVSDGHEGGVTSCVPEVKQVIAGFAQHAKIVLLNGDDFEYESPSSFMDQLQEIKDRHSHLRGDDYKNALRHEVESILHQKVAEDIAGLRKFISENPERMVVKVIGNHENFITFRNELAKLEIEYPNFQWVPEVAIIPIPGGKKGKRDRLLGVHGDLQMDDLGIVEDGGTDRERKCYTHEQMAEKVVNIAIKSWSPSAQKQEKGQSIVDWWRKPKPTAKILYAELEYRAKQGDFFNAIKKNDLSISGLNDSVSRLEKRKKKFESWKCKLDEREDLTPEQRDEQTLVYDKSIETIDQRLANINARLKVVEGKSGAYFPHSLKSSKTVLHYKKLGKNEPRLFTSESLERVTHINYGHTHVSAEGIEIKGMKDRTVTVSNNASVTGVVMRRPLDEDGRPAALARGASPATDLGNLSMLVYRVKDGKITQITTAGQIIAENIQQVKQLIRAMPIPPKPIVPAASGTISGADDFTSEAVLQKKAAGRE